MGDDVLHVLKEEPGREVIQDGETVRRQTGWWKPAVHALLRHLEAVGFPYAPRVIGTGEQGHELLTYIAGDSGAAGWAAVVSDEGLAAFARLLREYHDAVSTFVPPEEAIWAFAEGAPAPGETICHNDFGPWNVVWRDGRPVGLLDWDFAGPGPALDDVAYGLEYAVPFRDDATALRWLRYDRPPDRRHRIRVFAEAYGLQHTAGLVDAVARRQRLDVARVKVLAARGVEPQTTWVGRVGRRRVTATEVAALFRRPPSEPDLTLSRYPALQCSISALCHVTRVGSLPPLDSRTKSTYAMRISLCA